MMTTTGLRRFSILCALAVLFAPAAASAQTEVTGIRAMGMGEAFTALPAGSGALTLNPAGISALHMYNIETSYAHDTSTGVNALHVSVTDGKSNMRLGGGIGYSFRTSSRNAELSNFTGHDLYGALSFPVVPEWLIVGATVHYLDYSLGGDDYAKGVTMDAGLLLSMGDFVSFGHSTRNILSIDGHNRNLESRFGLNVHAYQFSVGFDTVLDFGSEETAVGWAAGAEVLLMQMVPLRLGYQRNGALDQQHISAGAGYRSEVIGGDLLFRQELGESDRRMLGFALNVYL